MKNKFMKISMIATCNLILSLNSVYANQDYTCEEIHQNYINAVNEFKDAAQAIYKGLKSQSQSQTPFQAALQNAIKTIKRGNYDHPTLQNQYLTITNAEGRPADVVLTQLGGQVTSSGTRVEQWKAPNTHNSKHESCRTVWGCDLGTDKTKCGNNQ